LDQGDLKEIRQLLHGIKELCELDSRYEDHLTEAQGEVVESILGAPYVHPSAKTVVEKPSQVQQVHGAEMPEESQQVREAITAESADIVLDHTEGSTIQADESTEVRPREKMELARLQRLLRIFRPLAKRRAQRSEGLKNDAE
jgi:hypothetical protein